jgi:hypothetical protein
MVALFEVQALMGSPLVPGGVVSNPAYPWVVINANVSLRAVVDLTDDVSAQVPLGTTAQELTGDWRGYQLRNPGTSVKSPTGAAPTQNLGLALYNMVPVLEGFITLSARLSYHKILGVFPEHLLPGSTVRFEYTDASGTKRTYSVR